MHLSDCFLELFTYVRFLADSPEMVDVDYAVVREDVGRLVDRMQERVEDSGFSAEQLDQARFAVFAWADETVLCSGWTGVRDWLRQPLQREYYGTANAGEEFFERLGKLLGGYSASADEGLFADFGKDEAPEAGDTVINGNAEVIEVYTLCLSLGYTGKYFNAEDGERLEQLRHDCVSRIMGQSQDEDSPVFPKSYGSAGAGSRKRGYGRVFDPLSIVFFLLPVLVAGGLYLAYRGLLEYSLKMWLG